jgi:ribonuclease I
LSCFAEHKYDPYCFVDYKFSEDQFSKQELKDLNKYWPAIGPMKDFWGYEWDKHGTCYLHILKNI